MCVNSSFDIRFSLINRIIHHLFIFIDVNSSAVLSGTIGTSGRIRFFENFGTMERVGLICDEKIPSPQKSLLQLCGICDTISA